jgi:hypothetical protein
MKTEKVNVIKVCIGSCLEQPFTETVGNKTHTFCCENGFKKTLKAFAESVDSDKRFKGVGK